MSFYTFIIPAVTFVSFFMYIFMSQCAWLPKSGTTEWVKRSAFPPKMADCRLGNLRIADFVFALISSAVYFGISAVTGYNFLPLFGTNTVYIICSGLTVGIVFLISRLLFTSYKAAVLSVIFTVADISTLSMFSSELDSFAGLFLIALYVLFICLSVKRPILLILSGVLLGAAVFYNAAFSVFVIFGAVVTFTAASVWGKKQLFWMFPVFSIVLSGVVCCLLSYLTQGSFLPEIHLTLSYTCLDPVYLFCAAVCVVIAIVHIFREKSFSALIISIGAISSAACVILGVPAAGLFGGLAMAFSGNIIITRGRLPHKLFAVIFAVVICAGIILTACSLLSLPYPEVYGVFRKLAGYWIYL